VILQDLRPFFLQTIPEEKANLLIHSQQIAISLASADLEFAELIGKMLEQLSYIDDCDTLGQKTGSEQIHKVCSM
jgi:hypothetical protein